MKKRLQEINWITTLPVVLILIALIVLNAINPNLFGTLTESGAVSLAKSFGWMFNLVTLVQVIVVLILLFHPIGKVKIGGPDAKPQFGLVSWIGMAVCSSIGIGIIFWGVAEPMYHYATPCAEWGIKAFSDDGIANALAQSFVHYGFQQYAYYAIFGILIALAAYNFKQPMAISSAFYFLRRKPLSKGWSNVVNVICIAGCISGIIYSLGIGVMQVGSGLHETTGIPITNVLWTVITFAVVILFTFSSKIGLEKGMKVASDWNIRIYIVLLAFVLIVGPTLFITDMGSESIGVYIEKFVSKTMFTGGADSDEWAVSWTLFMWASTVVYGPLIGMFMAKIDKGRTIREVVIGQFLVPTFITQLWFIVFGGTGIFMQRSGQYDLWSGIQTDGLESAIFKFFENLPGGQIVIWLFLICIIVSFVTLADAACGNVSLMCMKDQTALAEKEAPTFMKVTWGVLMGLVALAFINFGGIFTVRRVPILASVPVYLITAVAIYSFVKLFFTKNNHILTHEGAYTLPAGDGDN